MSRVLYSLRSRSFFTFSRLASTKATTSCMTMFTNVHSTVAPSAERNPESNTKSARQ